MKLLPHLVLLLSLAAARGQALHTLLAMPAAPAAPDPSILPVVSNGTLAAGWTFDPGSGTAATWHVTNRVGGDTLVVNLPDGVAKDSIWNTSTSDGTAGLVRPVGDDFDIAVCLGTHIKGWYGRMHGFIARGADDTQLVRATDYADADTQVNYNYARSGGSGAAWSITSLLFLEGTPSWMRLQRISASQSWTFYCSADGVNWVPWGATTCSFTPQTLKVCFGNVLAPLAYQGQVLRVVDLLARGSTDARDAAPYGRVGAIMATDFSSLPGWLSLSWASGGIAQVSDGTLRLVCDQEVDGSYARATCTAPPFDSAGMVFRAKLQVAGTGSSWLYFGLAGDPVALDQYSSGATYGVEYENGPAFTKVCRANVPDEAGASNDEPYTWLSGNIAVPEVASWVWWRVERVGARLRVRHWTGGNAEPATWDYDGQDAMISEPLRPHFSFAHNPGTTGTDSEFLVDDLTFYELIP